MWKTGLVGLFGVCLWGSVAMGSGAPPYVDPSREFVVSAIPGQGQNDPRLWGDAVAWDLGLSGDVYAKVLSSGELVPVSVGEGGSSHVNIYGHRIVWDTWILSDVHVFDMLTRTSSCVGGYESPDIYESLVVWHGHEGDIYGKDLGTGQEYRFSYSSGPWNHLNNPRIWGDTVVWNEWGNSNLWGSRVSTGTVFPVTTCGTVDWPPADLQGDIVVWRDNRNVRGDNNLDIYAADISDPSHVVEFPVCTNPFEQSEPQIYGNIIVWRDHRNADEDIYGYDLVSKTEFPIALGPGDQFSPSVYENMVVWSTETGTATEIHGNYIIPEPGAFSVLVLGRLALVRRRKRR